MTKHAQVDLLLSICGLIVGLTESDPVCDRQKLTHSHHQHNPVNDEADLIRSQQLTLQCVMTSSHTAQQEDTIIITA